MSVEHNNPLTKYFRKPAIYFKLPSNGRWWNEESIEIPAIGELGMYPMTTKDEITLRTPDALLNGQGVVDVIHSCCPNIKNAWDMPSVDVDAVLIALRIASYGNLLNFESICPHCKEENDHDVNLSSLLDSVNCPDYSKPVVHETLKIKLHPQKYYTVNRINHLNFEQEKLNNVLALTEDADPAVRAANLKEIMQRIIDIGLTAVAESTEYIEIEDGRRIDNKEFITEFYQNVEIGIVKDIQDKLNAISAEAKLPPLQLQCNECKNPYEVDLMFDYANFFARGF
jgi:hypothetical protein